ncbi:MAG: ABC transporter ATP-binding protein [Anaerolineales bacterium]|nr:MAG: ABC transporter ATP-binding protein [Anaerolineales bacterium]
MSAPTLQTIQLVKQYQMGSLFVEALKGVDLSIQAGEFVAIMGPSGSGKSTLLHLMGGLDKPTSGEVILAGKPLSQLNDYELARIRRLKVGFVFQFYNLIPTLTAAENIALPLLIDGVPLRRYRERLDELLELVNLSDRAQHKPDQLSGGQQQRVAIARAFVNQPEIVLADEPTGNLDTRSGTAILELLQRSRAELGATIVIVTHDPRAASYAQRVIFLRDGKIAKTLGSEGGEVSLKNIMAEMEALEA